MQRARVSHDLEQAVVGALGLEASAGAGAPQICTPAVAGNVDDVDGDDALWDSDSLAVDDVIMEFE